MEKRAKPTLSSSALSLEEESEVKTLSTLDLLAATAVVEKEAGFALVGGCGRSRSLSSLEEELVRTRERLVFCFFS